MAGSERKDHNSGYSRFKSRAQAVEIGMNVIIDQSGDENVEDEIRVINAP